MNPETTDAKQESAKGYQALRSNLIDLVGLFKTGIERVAEIQKSALDLAAKQTTETVKACKKVLPKATPGVFVLELAEQSFKRFVDNNKKVVDLVVEQGTALMEATKRNTEFATKIAEDVTTEAKQSVERANAAQKSVLEFASEQNKAVGKTLKEQVADLGEPATAIADSMEKGVETLIKGEKELLDNQTELVENVSKSFEATAGKE